MLSAYQDEINLMPYIGAMERNGVYVDIELLEHDTNFYYERMDWLDNEIKAILKQKVDVDSNEDLANAIEAAGLSKGFASTPTGKRSTAKDSLIAAIDHPVLLGHLLVRGSVATCLRTFLAPWLAQAKAHGRLYIKWNQFRNYTDTGARTGRLSSSPNLQNIPTDWAKLIKQLAAIQYALPFELPKVRKYIIPKPGYVFIGRDYSAQEMRLLAHFTDGALLQSICDNPTRDIHLIAADIAGVTRTVAKTLGFAILYGAGAARVAEQLGITVGDAMAIRKKFLAALPEIKDFQKLLTENAKNGLPTATLGGRLYYVQSPSIVNGVHKTFEYKLTNYKIQGSAADQTKRAMYDYCRTTRAGELVLSVHDQLVIQCPEECKYEESHILGEAVNGAYQEVLKYRVISEEDSGRCFADLKGGEGLKNLLGPQDPERYKIGR